MGVVDAEIPTSIATVESDEILQVSAVDVESRRASQAQKHARPRTGRLPTSFTAVDLHDDCAEGIAAILDVIRGINEVPQEANSSKKATLPRRSGFPWEGNRFVTTIRRGAASIISSQPQRQRDVGEPSPKLSTRRFISFIRAARPNKCQYPNGSHSPEANTRIHYIRPIRGRNLSNHQHGALSVLYRIQESCSCRGHCHHPTKRFSFRPTQHHLFSTD
jgi:hypothetical protein